MKFSDFKKEKLLAEVQYSASRSSGPGGQNVNKVNTQVELRFSVVNSNVFTISEKELLQVKLKNRINLAGELVLSAKMERSQIRNKEQVNRQFFQLLEKALTRPKKRVKTKPTLASVKKRLEKKKLDSARKQLRKPPEF